MDKIKRRSPKKGYDNIVKKEYREKVWSYLSPKAIPVLNKHENARVLLLPSKEGIEIDVAISHGIKPHQIIAIDENPALLAHAKWKDKIPSTNRFGCKVSQIGDKIKKNGWFLVAANLDFCNTFSAELIDELNQFFDKTPICNKFSFCITMGKGREDRALNILLKHIKSPEIFKNYRLAVLWELLEIKLRVDDSLNIKDAIALDFEETYFSTFPMIYAGFSIKEFSFDKYSKTKTRLDILIKRAKRIDTKIHIGHGYSVLRMNELLEDIKEERGRSKKTMDSYKYELKKMIRYKKNETSRYELMRKRDNLLSKTMDEITTIMDELREGLNIFCEKEGIISCEKYKKHYQKAYYESKALFF